MCTSKVLKIKKKGPLGHSRVFSGPPPVVFNLTLVCPFLSSYYSLQIFCLSVYSLFCLSRHHKVGT